LEASSQTVGRTAKDILKSPPSGGDLEGADFAVIFDMDGTLIDNTPYHFKSWQALFKKYGKGDLKKETYYTEISGVPVFQSIKRIFGGEYDEAGLKKLFEEKEEFYRKEYGPHVKSVEGLENFLAELKNAGIKMAMATSASVTDINFILDRIPIRKYFDVIVDSTMITEPKPSPQIFLKAAEILNTRPENCVVFEDSLAGIKAANSGGMKVVGITTGHTAAELHPVNLVIDNYTGLSAAKMAALFKN
jgi:beta-phosphoglucomutase